jgi:hypothetical protein
VLGGLEAKGLLFSYPAFKLPGQSGEALSSRDLRFATAEFILANPDHYAVKMCGGGTGAMMEMNSTEPLDGQQIKILTTVQQYGEQMKHPETYAGELEVLILAILLKVDIMVYSVRYFPNTQETRVVGTGNDELIRGDPERDDLPLLRIQLTGLFKGMDEVHYDAVVPCVGSNRMRQAIQRV